MSEISLVNIDEALLAALKAKYPNHAVKLDSYSLTAESITYGQVRTLLDSLSEVRDSLTINNCSDIPQTHSASLNVTVAVGTEASLTKGFSSTSRNSVSLNIGAAQKLGMQFSSSNDVTVNTTSSERQTTQTTETRNEQFTRTVPPRTQFTAELVRKRRLDQIDFTAPVLASGSATLTSWHAETRCTGPVVAGVCVGQWIPVLIPDIQTITIESALPESDRRFRVEGVLQSITAFDTKVLFRSEEIKDVSKFPCNEPIRNLQPQSLRPMDTSGDEIGPPDGIHYEIISTQEVTRMTPACGFNDLGVPNGGLFSIEDREYSEYSNGKLIRTWLETHEVFLRCVEV